MNSHGDQESEEERGSVEPSSWGGGPGEWFLASRRGIIVSLPNREYLVWTTTTTTTTCRVGGLGWGCLRSGFFGSDGLDPA